MNENRTAAHFPAAWRTARLYTPTFARWPVRLPVLAAITMLAVAALLAIASARPGMTDLVPASVRSQADAAERTMARAERALAAARRAEGVPSEPDADEPSGLIGGELTSITTTVGSLEAKRLSTNPLWARALVVRLHQAGVRSGDIVAAGFSGSFPGLNLACVCACQSLGVRLVVISSVTASTYGANQPGFTWPEIERRLVRAGIIGQASVALSVGGAGDAALDLDEGGRTEAERIARQVAREAGVALLRPRDFQDSIGQRFDVYARAAQGRPIRLYISVGGTEASLGRSQAILHQRNGFLPPVAFDFSPGRGMIARFAERGVPVLMLLNVRDLAARWRIL